MGVEFVVNGLCVGEEGCPVGAVGVAVPPLGVAVPPCGVMPPTDRGEIDALDRGDVLFRTEFEDF